MTGVETGQIVVGEVTSLDDKKKLGRVKVKYPHLGDVESDWCPVVTMMAGPGRGFVCRPEVHDHVLVALVFGDPNQAYVLGASGAISSSLRRMTASPWRTTSRSSGRDRPRDPPR